MFLENFEQLCDSCVTKRTEETHVGKRETCTKRPETPQRELYTISQ